MIEEMSSQEKLEKINLVKTWHTAGIQSKLELQRAMFRDGLVWSHETGFLNHKNTTFMDALRRLFQIFGDSEEPTEEFLVKFGVPDGI